MMMKNTGDELDKLKKKMARLEKMFDKAKGKPLVQKRIMKSAESVTKKIKKLEG